MSHCRGGRRFFPHLSKPDDARTVATHTHTAPRFGSHSYASPARSQTARPHHPLRAQDGEDGRRRGRRAAEAAGLVGEPVREPRAGGAAPQGPRVRERGGGPRRQERAAPRLQPRPQEGPRPPPRRQAGVRVPPHLGVPRRRLPRRRPGRPPRRPLRPRRRPLLGRLRRRQGMCVHACPLH